MHRKSVFITIIELITIDKIVGEGGATSGEYDQKIPIIHYRHAHSTVNTNNSHQTSGPKIAMPPPPPIELRKS